MLKIPQKFKQMLFYSLVYMLPRGNWHSLDIIGETPHQGPQIRYQNLEIGNPHHTSIRKWCPWQYSWIAWKWSIQQINIISCTKFTHTMLSITASYSNQNHTVWLFSVRIWVKICRKWIWRKNHLKSIWILKITDGPLCHII